MNQSFINTERGINYMKKVLFIATVVRQHIMVFHIPYLEWFKQNGYEVHVAARNDYENKDECKIPFCDKFYDLPFERSPFKKNNFYVQKKLKKIISKHKYEIIHCHTPVGGALARLAACKARKNGTKVIYTAHGFHFYKGAPILNWLLYYPIEKWLARYTDVLITINKEDYNRAKMFKATRVEYVPGVGVDIDKFQNIDINREEKRKSIGIKKDEFMILSVGELNRNKNHQTIIKAIAKLKNDKIKYIICGQGPLEEELKKLAQKLKIQKQVIFLGFREDIPEIMSIADLFVFPSFREGLPLSLMEAMASGLPIICSNIRGNCELIEDGKNGYLVSPDDVDGFASAIEKILEIDCKLMKISNMKKIKRFDISNVKKFMQKLYISALKDYYFESCSINEVNYNE